MVAEKLLYLIMDRKPKGRQEETRDKMSLRASPSVTYLSS
jgi:hypothetical protein